MIWNNSHVPVLHSANIDSNILLVSDQPDIEPKRTLDIDWIWKSTPND